MAPPRRRDRRRLRAAARHQPPRPLRPHRPAAGEAEGGARGRASSPSPAAPTGSAASTSTTCSAAAATCAGRPTASRSSPTCSSRWSCSAAPSPPTWSCAAWPPIPATPRPTSSTPGPQLGAGLLSKLTAPAWSLSNHLFGQSAEGGALPTLYAATEPDLPGGSLIGPGGFASMRGAPALESPSGAALDEDTARRLWEVSEELTGVEFTLLAGRPAATIRSSASLPCRPHGDRGCCRRRCRYRLRVPLWSRFRLCRSFRFRRALCRRSSIATLCGVVDGFLKSIVSLPALPRRLHRGEHQHGLRGWLRNRSSSRLPRSRLRLRRRAGFLFGSRASDSVEPASEVERSRTRWTSLRHRRRPRPGTGPMPR